MNIFCNGLNNPMMIPSKFRWNSVAINTYFEIKYFPNSSCKET